MCVSLKKFLGLAMIQTHAHMHTQTRTEGMRYHRIPPNAFQARGIKTTKHLKQTWKYRKNKVYKLTDRTES